MHKHLRMAWGDKTRTRLPPASAIHLNKAACQQYGSAAFVYPLDTSAIVWSRSSWDESKGWAQRVRHRPAIYR
jgi:hypothetical protein